MGNDENFDEEMERREYRHKRRIRNQVISYVTVAVVLIGLATGGVLGVRQVVEAMNDKKQAQELKEQLEELAETEEPVVVEAPTEAESPAEEKSYLDEIVDACIAEMPLEDKVAGLFFITPEALTGTDAAIKAGDTTKEKLNQYAVGGLIYSAKNIKSSEQLKEMLQNTRSWSKYPIFLGIEEEGGSISGVAEKGLADNVGTMSDIGAGGDAAKVSEAATTVGSYLKELGFDMNFAPVADVVTEENTTIGERSVGTDTVLVADMIGAYVTSLQDAGVSACMKYFPGMGDTTTDIHEGMTTTEKTAEDLETIDFPVYQRGIEADTHFIMVSNLSVPNVVGDNTPSSLSDKMINEILRGQLGYQGIVITDAMNMSAITEYYTVEEAAVKVLLAGGDMILMPEDFEAAYNGVLEAVNNGTLSEERINESLQRIFRVKYRDKVEE